MFGARARLVGVEHPEAHGLLDLRGAVDLDVGDLPERLEALGLLFDDPVPAGVQRADQRRRNLIAQRGDRALARPAVGDELGELEVLADIERGRAGQPCPVGMRVDLHRRRAVRGVDDVAHRRGHVQLAGPGAVHEHARGGPSASCSTASQRVLDHLRDARVASTAPGRSRWRRVRTARRCGPARRPVRRGSGWPERAPGQRHQPLAVYPDRVPAGDCQTHRALEHAASHVEHAFVLENAP